MNFLYVVFIYLGYLLIWSAVVLVAYYLSIVFKKKGPMTFIQGIAMFVAGILGFLVGIWGLAIGYQLLVSGEILWLIVFIFIGFGLISGLYNILAMPFIFVPAYFSEKYEKYVFELDQDYVEFTEVLGDDGKVLRKVEGAPFRKRKIAAYFLIAYFLDLGASLITEQEDYRWGDYIFMPAFKIGFWFLISFILVSIFNLIRGKSFRTIDKSKVFINTVRVMLAISIVAAIFLVFIDLFY